MTLTLWDCHFLIFILQDPHTSPSRICFLFAFALIKALFHHRFIRRCSGRLEIIGKACFLYGPELGCRIGSGAEASPLVVTSICSIPLVSIGYSTGVWGFAVLAEAPRPQKSPGENLTGLTGVRGLPINLRGDRIFGSKENFSFTLSSTDGATYVKPRKTWLALSLRVESSGLSTGVWRVNFESNWLTSSSDCNRGLKGGSTFRAKSSSQLMCLKNGCAWTSPASPGPAPRREAAFLFSSFREEKKHWWKSVTNQIQCCPYLCSSNIIY